MPTIPRNHTRKIAALRALPLLCLMTPSGGWETPRPVLSPVETAWAAYDASDTLALTDYGDGSYRMGRHYETTYSLFPEGHPKHAAALEYAAQLAARDARKDAEERAKTAAKRAAYAPPIQRLTPGMIQAVSILIHWSECGLFEDEQLFTGPDCWQQVDFIARQARAALISENAGHYDKTKFTVTFADGETYTGRWDISARDSDGRTLHGHILDFLNVYAGRVTPAHWTAADQARELGEEAPAYLAYLARYQIGPAPKPRVKVWTDGTLYTASL